MQKRIFKSTVFSCIIVVILSVYCCVAIFTGTMQTTMNQQAYSQTMLLMHILETSKEDPVSTIKKIENEIYGRITFVDESGTVVYDSDYDSDVMESHSDRQEIIRAKRDGIAINQRMSETTDKLMYYCAAYVKDIGVIRVGITSASFAKSAIISTSPVIWVFMFAFLTAVIVMSTKTRTGIVNTVERYNIETGEGEIYDELSPFVQKIKSQNDIIKRQVQTLTDEKLKLQSIFMNIKEGIVVCDSRLKIAQTNREARKIFSFDEYEDNFMKAVRLPQLQQAMEKALAGETTHQTFSWQDKWYQCVTSPNNYHNDKGAILIVLDITQQVESEQNRRQFTDNVTHELKTPLTSIIGYSQLITNDIARPDDVKKFVTVIEQNAQNLMDMINDIMKISSLESQDSFSKTPLYLDEIINRTIGQEKLNAQNRNITVSANVQRMLIVADEGQMYQLAGNLISNAIKYNVENGTIDVQLYREDDMAVLSVKDSGIGIPRDQQDKIFERFYVVDKSRNKKISSTGLGLSIVKHIVKAHEGTIELVSRPGKGSQFIVKLPLE